MNFTHFVIQFNSSLFSFTHVQQQQQAIRMQILNHQQQMQQQMAEKMQQEPRMQRPQNMPPNTPNPNQPHQSMMPQSMGDTTNLQPPQVNMPGPPPPQVNIPGMARKKIWSGVLEWFKKEKSPSADKVPQQVPCYVVSA